MLGASLQSLLILLSQKFALLVVVAGGVALPIVYLGMTYWLQNYPYRTEIAWWMAVAPIVFTLLITALTIGYQVATVSQQKSNK